MGSVEGFGSDGDIPRIQDRCDIGDEMHSPKTESDEGMRQKFVKRKGDYYYRPNNSGYTSDIEEAGLYSKEEAFKEQESTHGEVLALPAMEIIEKEFDATLKRLGNLISKKLEAQGNNDAD